MHRYKFGLIIFGLIIIACHHSTKPFVQRLEECTLLKDTSAFEDQFYPFVENGFDKKSILLYFNTGVQIDSGFDLKSNGDTVKFYKFYNNDSRMIFSLNNYSKGEEDFDIALFEINSDFFMFKNGIQVNMLRRDFFKTIETKETNCDTFDIVEPYHGCYFRFTFREDKLKAICKEYIH
jgi:hypothetical protein